MTVQDSEANSLNPGVNCPCEDCLCVPICRHKPWGVFWKDCRPVLEFIIDKGILFIRNNLEPYMKPTTWRTQVKGNRTAIINQFGDTLFLGDK